MSSDQPTMTCQHCGDAFVPHRIGRRRRYPFCSKPKCQRAGSLARTHASRAQRYRLRKYQPFTEEELRGMLLTSDDLIYVDPHR